MPDFFGVYDRLRVKEYMAFLPLFIVLIRKKQRKDQAASGTGKIDREERGICRQPFKRYEAKALSGKMYDS